MGSASAGEGRESGEQDRSAAIARLRQRAIRAEEELDKALASQLPTREVGPLLDEFSTMAVAVRAVRDTLRIIEEEANLERRDERVRAVCHRAQEELHQMNVECNAEVLAMPPLTRKNWQRRVLGPAG